MFNCQPLWLEDNTWGIYTRSSNPNISSCRFINNTTAGIWNASTNTVVANGSWWGDAAGPQHVGNPLGTGESVSDNVLYNPWLSQEPNAYLQISNPSLSPAELNPAGGSVTFSGAISAAADWTLVIKDANDNAVKTMAGSGTAISQSWSGDSDGGPTVENGHYTYVIDVTDGVHSAAQVFGTLEVTSQTTAILAAPINNEMFVEGTSTIDVVGTAKAIADFQNYVLEYGVGENPVSWFTIKNSTLEVDNALLAAWSVAGLSENLYSLRLTVNDTEGHSAVRTSTLRFLRVESADPSDLYISPNNDGIQDLSQITAAYSYPVDWTLEFKNAAQAVVRTFSGSGMTVTESWDGANELSAVVPDGNYDYQLTAAGSETGVAAATISGTIVVDATPPTATISSPLANAVLFNDVPILGTADDSNFASYRIDYEQVAGGSDVIVESTTPVVNDNLVSWITSDSESNAPFANGNYLVWLVVKDRAGNSTASLLPVTLDNLLITNVSASSHGLDVSRGDTSTISFELNKPAQVSLQIIPELEGPEGTPVYTAALDCTSAGTFLFEWDGHDDSGTNVPDEAYLYVLSADNGTQSAIYAPQTRQDSASVVCSQESNYYPYKNDPLTIDYETNLPSRVDIHISWGPLYFKIMDSKPHLPGAYTFDWDGRDPDDTILNGGGVAYCTSPAALPENTLITTGDSVQVTDLTVDPREIGLSFGQFTRIHYTLAADAIVTIQLVSPSGQHLTLVNEDVESSGSYEYFWNVYSAQDVTGKEFEISEEGAYQVLIQAHNPTTGTKTIRKAYLGIGR